MFAQQRWVIGTALALAVSIPGPVLAQGAANRPEMNKKITLELKDAKLRFALEMLFKAAIMGVPIVGSRTSPTNLALAVAERLNITKPALYHYFHNKEEVLLECYRLGTGMIEETLNEIAAHCGTGLEKVEAFIYSYANVMTVTHGKIQNGSVYIKDGKIVAVGENVNAPASATVIDGSGAFRFMISKTKM